MKETLSYDAGEQQIELARKVADLRETLKVYNKYKSYDKNLAKAEKQLIKAKTAYDRLGTRKRLEKYLSAELTRGVLIAEHKSVDVEAVEAKLQSFEGFIDRKYWDDDTLFSVFFRLRLGLADTLEEALEPFENLRKH